MTGGPPGGSYRAFAGPLPSALDAAVPLRVVAMLRAGGPTEAEWADARAFGGELADRGDRLLFRGAGAPGEAAAMFNKLAAAVAVLAFLPGGVPLFGRRWVAADVAKGFGIEMPNAGNSEVDMATTPG